MRALADIRSHEATIYIHELPGICARGRDLDDALDILPGAVEHHLSWLASHGFDYPADPIEIELVEQCESRPGEPGVLFDADREVPTSEQIQAAIRAASLARRDVIDLYRSMSAFRRERAQDLNGKTLADHLHDLARRDIHFAGLWSDDPAPLLPVDPVRSLQTSGAFAGETFQSLDAAACAEVRVVHGEQWTVNKSIRLQVAHLREMYPVLQAIATG